MLVPAAKAVAANVLSPTAITVETPAAEAVPSPAPAAGFLGQYRGAKYLGVKYLAGKIGVHSYCRSVSFISGITLPSAGTEMLPLF